MISLNQSLISHPYAHMLLSILSTFGSFRLGCDVKMDLDKVFGQELQGWVHKLLDSLLHGVFLRQVQIPS